MAVARQARRSACVLYFWQLPQLRISKQKQQNMWITRGRRWTRRVRYSVPPDGPGTILFVGIFLSWNFLNGRTMMCYKINIAWSRLRCHVLHVWPFCSVSFGEVADFPSLKKTTQLYTNLKPSFFSEKKMVFKQKNTWPTQQFLLHPNVRRVPPLQKNMGFQKSVSSPQIIH